MKWLTFRRGIYTAEVKDTSLLWLTVSRSSSGRSLHASLVQGDKDHHYICLPTPRVWGVVRITRKGDDRTSLISAAKRWAEDQLKSPLERLATCREARRVDIELASDITLWSPDIRSRHVGFAKRKTYESYWIHADGLTYCLGVKYTGRSGRGAHELSLSSSLRNSSNLLRVHDTKVLPYLISEKAILAAGTEMLENLLQEEE